MSKSQQRPSNPEINFDVDGGGNRESISLETFESAVYSHPCIGDELAKNVIEFKYRELARICPEKLKRIGFADDDVERLPIDLVKDTPSQDLGFSLLPGWVLEFLDGYWIPFNPQYVVRFENQSEWSHDFVVAYETASGLIDVTETSAEPGATATVTCAPCWDMLSYAWSVWNPDDNVELSRTRTFTIDEINEQESVFKDCEDTWEVRISYE